MMAKLVSFHLDFGSFSLVDSLRLPLMSLEKSHEYFTTVWFGKVLIGCLNIHKGYIQMSYSF